MKFLILGGGAVVREYYLPALEMLGKLSDVLIVEQAPEAIKEIREQFANVKYEAAGFREYLSKQPIDTSFKAAIIALPNSLHAEAVEMALAGGLDVLCEKPLAMSDEDCLRLSDLAKARGKILTVGMVRRLLPSFIALSEALKKGLIGNLESVEIEDGEPYAWISDSGLSFKKENGGVLADMGVHYLDFAQYILGTLTPENYKDDYRGGVEANCEFRLISSGGIPVYLKLSRTRELANKIIFKGQRGRLVAEKNAFGHCMLYLDKLNARISPQTPYQAQDWPISFISCFAQQLAEFNAAVSQRISCGASALEAQATMKLINWAYNQHDNGLGASSIPDKDSSQARPILADAKVVITGATGFIGGHLVGRLADLGFSEITAILRSYKTCAEIARFSLDMRKVNLLDYDQVKQALKGARFVFHLAYGNDGDNASAITVKGTQNVVNAACECQVESVVVLSTMYVFGSPATATLVDESWPYCPRGGRYGQDKARMERWCLKRAKSSAATRIVVLNPSCVYGPRGTTYTYMPVEMSRNGTFCWVEEGNGIANYTFVDNLIDAVILAAECKKAHGARFIINDGFCSWREFLVPLLGSLAESLSSFNRKELVLMNRAHNAKLKDLIMYLAQDLQFIDIVNRIPALGFGKRIVLKIMPGLRSYFIRKRKNKHVCRKEESTGKCPPVWLADLFAVTCTKFSSAKAQKVLGWEPKVKLNEALEKTRLWLKDK